MTTKNKKKHLLQSTVKSPTKKKSAYLKKSLSQRFNVRRDSQRDAISYFKQFGDIKIVSHDQDEEEMEQD